MIKAIIFDCFGVVITDKLGVRCDECLFVDDRQDYVDSATAVGMTGFLYTGLDKLRLDLGNLL